MTIPDLEWERELACCWSACQEIWADPDLKNYTDHGITHSKHVVSRLAALNSYYHWSDYEKLVFLCAALLHDIGMQYRVWAGQAAGSGKKTRYVYHALKTCRPDELNDLGVRQAHIKHGASLIEAELFEKRTWRLPSAFCSGRQAGIDLLFKVYQIAFAHSDGRNWDRFCDVTSPLRPREAYGMKFRPRLLAGTLRLCDELDGSLLRLSRPDDLWSFQLSDESRVHWLACFYVTGVDIEMSEGRLSINLRWRVPVGADRQLLDQIQDLLTHLRVARIKRTVQDVNRMYELGGEGELHIAEYIRMSATAEDECVQTVTDELRRLVSGFRRALKASDPWLRARLASLPTVSAPSRTERREPVYAPPVTAVGDRGASPSASLEEQLKHWFAVHSQGTHWRLSSGVHTDCLVHSRALGSEPGIVANLAEAIAHDLKDDRVGLVVGVGTSTIGIAVSLALRLNANVTFALRSPVDGMLDERHSVLSIEEAPVLDRPADAKVVVVEDIIALGRSAECVVAELLRHGGDHGLREEDVLLYSVFRLSQDGEAGRSMVRGRPFCEIGDIYYAESADECELCKSGVPLRDELEAQWEEPE